MGGLVARAWMRVHGSARVARVITLGSPHHGTALARVGPGANAAQMRRAEHGGTWLQALDAGETAQTRALITSIYTHHDNIVAPQTSSVLAGARNIGFGGVGHVALGSNPRVLAEVMRELGELQGGMRGDGRAGPVDVILAGEIQPCCHPCNKKLRAAPANASSSSRSGCSTSSANPTSRPP
jgi:hypothetical protein